MASGKSLEKKAPRMVRVYCSKDGSPVRRKDAKVKMNKKERLKRRWEGRKRFEEGK
jgi:hypothetical protein